MKKGILSVHQLSFFPRLLFLIVVMITVVFMINTYIRWEFEEFNLEASTLAQQILYSRNGISYYDEDIDRVYPGIIDLRKFGLQENKELENAFFYGEQNKHITARIDLYYSEGAKQQFLTKAKKRKGDEELIYNLQGYRNLVPLYRAGYEGREFGPGGVRYKLYTLNVVIRNEDGILVPGYVEIEVMRHEA